MTEPAPPARHPLADLPGIIGRLPRYLVLAKELLADRELSRTRKAAVAGGLAYAAMPLDLVPGIIPVAGQLDDLAALLLALRTGLRGCSAVARDAHLAAANLAAEDLDRDLAAVQVAIGWIAGSVASGAVRVGRATARGAGR